MGLVWFQYIFVGVRSVLYVFVAYRCLSILYRIVYPYFIGCPVNLHKKAAGKWAVITGATDGIGREYALQLGEKGFNILLVSRTQSKLDKTRLEVLARSKEAKIEVRTFAFDFSASSINEYDEIVAELRKYEVGILVNNVGACFDSPNPMHLLDGGLPRLADMTTINCLPVVLLCKVALDQMWPRRAGIIINVASAAATVPISEWNLYGASKRFVMHLSSILHLEYAPYGITVQCVCPMLVVTKMSKVERPSLLSPTPDQYVRSALRSVGLASETSGYWVHQIQVEGMKLLPPFIFNRIIDYNNVQAKKRLARRTSFTRTII